MIDAQRFENLVSDVAKLTQIVQLLLGENGVDTRNLFNNFTGSMLVDKLSITDIINIGKKINQQEASIFEYSQYITSANKTQFSVGLPIVYLDGDISQMSKANKVTLNYKIGLVDSGYISGTCTCKYQGNTTWNSPKHNYSLAKMSNKVDVGWGAQKKYVLKGHYEEGSLIRNVVGAKLWGEMINSRSGNAGVLTKLKACPNCGAIDGFPCMLVLNGQFRGIFSFNIPKDKWMLNMGNDDSGTATEAILQCEGNSNAVRVKGQLTVTDVQNEKGFAIEYVPDEDDYNWMIESYNNMVNAVGKNISNSNFRSAISQYVDLDIVLDYYIHTCMIGGWDNQIHNFLACTYDGVQWFYIPYDMDRIFGYYRVSSKTLQSITIGPTFKSFSSINNLMYLLYTYDKTNLKTRYKSLRNSVLSVANVNSIITNCAAKIPYNVMVANNKLYPKSALSFAEQLAQMISWYRARCEYLDAEIDAL